MTPTEPAFSQPQHTSPSCAGLSVSIVVYRPDMRLLDRTVDTLITAAQAAHQPVGVAIVDNSDTPDAPDAPDLWPLIARLRDAGITTQRIAGQGNVGYGRGHNLAMDAFDAAAGAGRPRYHLILNPDIELEEASLTRALAFMEVHPSVGLLAPWVGDENGQRQYLCRRYPAVLDLLLRGFAPKPLRQLFAKRLNRYEMRDVIDDTDIVWEPPIVSGCFMLFRAEALKALGGFDARYFLYFEDYDLSLRAHKVAQVAYVPAVRAAHHGGGAARKGAAHIRMFGVSAWRFFNRFGWKWI